MLLLTLTHRRSASPQGQRQRKRLKDRIGRDNKLRDKSTRIETSNRPASRDYILGFRTEGKTLSACGGLGRFSPTGAGVLRSGNTVRQDRAGLQRMGKEEWSGSSWSRHR